MSAIDRCQKSSEVTNKSVKSFQGKNSLKCISFEHIIIIFYIKEIKSIEQLKNKVSQKQKLKYNVF